MKKIAGSDDNVHICLFAIRDIDIDEEIRYDYHVKGLPWRKKGTTQRRLGPSSSANVALALSTTSNRPATENVPDLPITENEVVGETSMSVETEPEVSPSGQASSITSNQPATEHVPDLPITENEIVGETSMSVETEPEVCPSGQASRTTSNQPATEYVPDLPITENEVVGETSVSVETEPEVSPSGQASRTTSNQPATEYVPDLPITENEIVGETSMSVETEPEVSPSGQASRTTSNQPATEYVPDLPITENEIVGETSMSVETEPEVCPSGQASRTTSNQHATENVPDFPITKNAIVGETSMSVETEPEVCHSTSGQSIIENNAVPDSIYRREVDLDSGSNANSSDFYDDSDNDSDYVPESVNDESDEENSPLPVTSRMTMQYHDNQSNNSNAARVRAVSPNLTVGHSPVGEHAVSPDLTAGYSPGDTGHAAILVMRTENQGKRKWDKGAYCPFCKTYQKKLPRHLHTRIHEDEVEVIRLKSIKDETLRDQKLTKLRHLGNYYHNTEVIRNQKGTIIPVYRPNFDANYQNYVPCSVCLGFFAKRDLWKHGCKLQENRDARNNDRDSGPQPKKSRKEHVRPGKLLLPSVGVSDKAHKILSGLRDDEEGVARLVKSDDLIKKLAEKLALKLGHDKDQNSYVRTKLRELGRLVLNYRDLTGEKCACLANLINPVKFSEVVAATRHTAGFDKENHQYETPSLALKIGHSLKKAAGILLGEAIMKEDEKLEKRCAAFLKLCDLRWEEMVSTHAHRTLNEQKRNNPTYLPLMQDVVKLTTYLKEEIERGKVLMSKNPSDVAAYKGLAEVTLTSILVFNRKRAGEVSKMKLADFAHCKKGGEDLMTDGLSSWEKELCRVVYRIEIIGKKARTVPVLLSEQVKQSLDVLKNSRDLVGVDPANEYMFPCNSEGHMRGCDALRKHANLCGARKPEYLRSTRLRKHIGTVSQVMNLKDHELDILARFMGHDIRVHRDYYRLPDQTMQLAKVTKVLLQMEKGDVTHLAGKSLDEIDVTEGEEIHLDDLSDADDPDEDVSQNIPRAPDITADDGSGPTGSDGQEGIPTGVLRETLNLKGSQGTKKKTSERKVWTKKEKTAVASSLRYFFIHHKLPGKREIEKAMSSQPVLQARNWKNIKDFVRNNIKKDDPLSFL
nr:uncharacterized protein LOC129278875 [Lytechinus pictus]